MEKNIYWNEFEYEFTIDEVKEKNENDIPALKMRSERNLVSTLHKVYLV